MRHDSPLPRMPHAPLRKDADAERASSVDMVRMPSTKPVAVPRTVADLAQGVKAAQARRA